MDYDSHDDPISKGWIMTHHDDPKTPPPDGSDAAAAKARPGESSQGPWRSRALIRSVFETLAEGVVLIAADGRIVRANAAAERILGLERPEIEGRSYVAPEWDIIGTDGQPLSPEEMAGPRAMREKIPVRDVVMGVRRPDGSTAWINVGATPLLTESGQVTGVIGTFTDITEHREVEQALRESEASLRSVFSSMDDLVFVLDRDGAFTSFYQPEHSSGLYRDPEQFLGKSLEEVMPPHVVRPAREAIDALLATHEPQQFDYALEMGGQMRWYGAKVSERTDGNGEPTGVTVVAREITESKRAQQALETAHATLEQRVEERTRELHDLREKAEQLAVMRERERLARDLHDAVSQTLFSVNLIADALPAIWERDADEGRQRLGELRNMTRGALAEMRGLLLELRPAALMDADPVELLGQLAASVGSRARLPITVTIEERLTPSPELKMTLYRVAQEALANVVRHAEASRASVTLRRHQGRLELTIEDDGRGFDAEDVFAGSMGLSIMRERAEAVGAVLRIDSRPGRGTRLVLTKEESREMRG